MNTHIKWLIAFFASLLSLSILSDTVITNYIYTVSNNYIHTYHENTITQKVKNTHYNYFFTNYLQDVVYQTTVNMETNILVSETLDVSRDVLQQASNTVLAAQGYANSASSSAQSSAQSAGNSSTYSARSATSAANSQTIYNNVVNYGNTTIEAMNQKQAWFDDNYGKLITNINVTIVTNIDNNYHYTYKNPSGIEYDRIWIYPLDLSGARVTVLPNSGQYASKNIRVFVETSSSDSETKNFIMIPSYVDSDTDGLRLNYVLDQESREKNVWYRALYNGNNTDYLNQSVVPQYAYWKNGVLYVKFQVWENGSVIRSLISKYEWSNFPNTIQWDSLKGANMTEVSAVNWGYIRVGSYSSRTIYVRSESRGSSTSDKVNFPDTLSPSDRISFNWMYYHNTAP